MAPGHCIGDPTIQGNKCLNPPQQMKLGRTCHPNCFALAHQACQADDKCVAFAFASLAGGGMYETFSVGLANAVPNKDWNAYAKPLPCCMCPGDGAFIPSSDNKRVPGSWNGGLHHWHTDHQCATDGSRDGQHSKGTAILFCYTSDGHDPSCPVAVEVDNNLGSALVLGLLLIAALYFGVGVTIGRHRAKIRGEAKPARLIASHPHYRHALELMALCKDGLAFSLERVGRSTASSRRSDAGGLRETLDDSSRRDRSSRAGSAASVGGSSTRSGKSTGKKSSKSTSQQHKGGSGRSKAGKGSGSRRSYNADGKRGEKVSASCDERTTHTPRLQPCALYSNKTRALVLHSLLLVPLTGPAG